MSIEDLLKEVVDHEGGEYVDEFLKTIKAERVYFFFFETNQKIPKNPGKNVVAIINVDKEHPITIPLIKNENGSNCVLYTNLELAKRCAEFECKIGKMKGSKACDMIYNTPEIDSAYIQGNYGNILLEKRQLRFLAEANA